MIKRFRKYCVQGFLEIKRTIISKKWISVVMLVCALLGIILAFSHAEVLSIKYSDGNIITKLSSKNFNFFFFYIKTLLILSAITLLTFLLTFNFYCCLVNFVFIIVATKYYFAYVFVSCILDGFSGYLLLIVLWIPLYLVNILLFTMYIIKIFELISYPCGLKGKLRILPYSCYWHGTKHILLRQLYLSIIFSIIYISIIIIILSLIF